ncbi:hypothetical protein F0L74_27305 [Chitinophaga agrisoli]|uniref:DUF5672 domain-containing protein n=1 Tax=Chitinophaga agrisoli TaxID=2607653 RepID=A0A5B2VNA1_9BACT|nr:DUF5672 family protein [Chitinophaga agrisoli]KAA2239896.1 hypothetical protein F0L74_27305 [Chitinophaga agrisoli]
MRADPKLCVIIPAHKSRLTVEEAISLQACYNRLQHYHCYLLHGADGFSPEEYLDIHPQLKLKRVPANWLSSVQQYNRMKVNPSFYELFRDYQFMLTYELDAYIFSNDITAHHGFDYDYIGAPIFEGYQQAAPDAPFHGALNSGFSMRNVTACRVMLDKLQLYKAWWKKNKFLLVNFPFLRRVVNPNWRSVMDHDHLRGYLKGGYFNEDIIWSEVIPALFPSFKVAPPEAAALFSFEVNPERLYQLTGQLPLGCHAWTRFPAFWKNHIHEFIRTPS